MYYPSLFSAGTEDKDEKTSGYPVSGPRFEPRISEFESGVLTTRSRGSFLEKLIVVQEFLSVCGTRRLTAARH
jgi:hypothetical protein